MLILINIPSLKHWAMLVLNLNNWTIEVYDSMASDGPHNELLGYALEALSNFMPFIADKVDLFDIKQRSCSNLDPYSSHHLG